MLIYCVVKEVYDVPIITKLGGAKFVSVKLSQMPTKGTPLKSAQDKQAESTGNVVQKYTSENS